MNKATDGTADSSLSSSQAGWGVEPPARKTPLYAAIHASRNQRQLVIKEIQGITGRKVICYVAGPQASVDRDDTPCFWQSETDPLWRSRIDPPRVVV